MKIDLKKNDAMKLQIPEFSCDNSPLGEHLNKYDMLQHLNSFSFNAIIGKPGSGKTSLLMSFLSGKGDNKVFRKVFSNILLVMPETSRNSMKKNLFKDHPEEKLYEELFYETEAGAKKIHDKIFCGNSEQAPTVFEITSRISQLEAASEGDTQTALTHLREVVQEYSGVDWTPSRLRQVA